MVQIDVLEKPIERIKETCAMMGVAEQFDRALPDLETFLEAEVARERPAKPGSPLMGCFISGAFWEKDRLRGCHPALEEQIGRGRHCECSRKEIPDRSKIKI